MEMTWLWTALALAGLMFASWLVSLPLRDASIADIVWGLGFVLVAWTSLLAASHVGERGWLLAGLTTIWGLRLAGYLLWRKWGQPEDPRYAALRERSGPRFWLTSLGIVFGLQGLLIWLVSLPLQMAIPRGGPLRLVDGAGLGLWVVGFLFESVGDWQLARFKAQPANAGRVCDRGLWRYTRHPNYFGDFLVWWGLWLLALGGGADVWTIVSPLLMSWLLIRVSGVVLTERRLAQRSEAYRRYMQRTSRFFPWPPRKESAEASDNASPPPHNSL
jgi:steroid 5-alpha reductase family enzyme